jgi:hypothetical protein
MEIGKEFSKIVDLSGRTLSLSLIFQDSYHFDLIIIQKNGYKKWCASYEFENLFSDMQVQWRFFCLQENLVSCLHDVIEDNTFDLQIEKTNIKFNFYHLFKFGKKEDNIAFTLCLPEEEISIEKKVDILYENFQKFDLISSNMNNEFILESKSIELESVMKKLQSEQTRIFDSLKKLNDKVNAFDNLQEITTNNSVKILCIEAKINQTPSHLSSECCLKEKDILKILEIQFKEIKLKHENDLDSALKKISCLEEKLFDSKFNYQIKSNENSPKKDDMIKFNEKLNFLKRRNDSEFEIVTGEINKFKQSIEITKNQLKNYVKKVGFINPDPLLFRMSNFNKTIERIGCDDICRGVRIDYNLPCQGIFTCQFRIDHLSLKRRLNIGLGLKSQLGINGYYAQRCYMIYLQDGHMWNEGEEIIASPMTRIILSGDILSMKIDFDQKFLSLFCNGDPMIDKNQFFFEENELEDLILVFDFYNVNDKITILD